MHEQGAGALRSLTSLMLSSTPAGTACNKQLIHLSVSVHLKTRGLYDDYHHTK